MKLIGYNARRKLFSMIIIGMLLVVGCSNPNTPDSETSDVDDSQEVTDTSQDVIEIEMWTRDYLADVVKDAAERFHDVSDGIRVNVVELPADQFSDQLSLALSSGEAPDIVSIDCTKAPYYSSIGAFVDITDKYESLDYKDNFSEGMVKLGKYEDEIYALPFAPDVSVLLYNKDHFEEAGLDSEKPPTTWDELFDYGEKLTTEDRYGYVYAGGDAGAHMFTFMPYVWNNGGQVLNEDGTECLLNENNAIEALQMFVDLTNKYKATPPSVTTYSWNEAQDAFLTRKSSMVVLGSPAIYMLNDDEYADSSYGQKRYVTS